MQKRYKKRSELTEKTNMGYPTLADELNIETVNDQLAKVPGFEHMLTYGSKKPRFIDGGGNETLRIESINESVSRITNGMQGLFEVRESKKNITEDDNYPALIDSKKWHAVFKDLVTAINDVSVPYQGEWGNLLSSPDWHLRAYKKMADIFPKLLSLTVKDSSVYEAIKFAEKMVPSYERQVKYVLNKFDNLNNSGSEGFEKLQQLHHDYKSRFIDQIARSRYDESVYLNDKNTLSEIKDPKKRFSIIKKYGLEDYDNGSWSNPEDWNGDTEFGTCDLTGKQGDLEPMTVMDKKGKIQEFEVLSDVAYQLHGLSGAY